MATNLKMAPQSIIPPTPNITDKFQSEREEKRKILERLSETQGVAGHAEKIPSRAPSEPVHSIYNLWKMLFSFHAPIVSRIKAAKVSVATLLTSVPPHGQVQSYSNGIRSLLCREFLGLIQITSSSVLLDCGLGSKPGTLVHFGYFQKKNNKCFLFNSLLPYSR